MNSFKKYYYKNNIKLDNKTKKQLAQFEELVFGNQNQRTIWESIANLSKSNEDIRKLLGKGSTQIGLEVNSKLIKDYNSFSEIILFRPDLLIDSNKNLKVAEFEIVIGGLEKIFYFEKEYHNSLSLFEGTYKALKESKKINNIKGDIAFIFNFNYKHVVEHFQNFIDDLNIEDFIFTTTEELEFRSDGIYVNRQKISAAYTINKSYKKIGNGSINDKKLLRYWLNDKITLLNAPSTLLDNKTWMSFFFDERFSKDLINEIGEERFIKLKSYIPKTILLDEHNLKKDEYKEYLIDPISHGKDYFIKSPFSWGSENLLTPIENEDCLKTWKCELQSILNNTEKYGTPIMQEQVYIDKYIDEDSEWNYKITPFYTYDGIESKHHATYCYMVNDSLKAHLTTNGKIAKVI